MIEVIKITSIILTIFIIIGLCLAWYLHHKTEKILDDEHESDACYGDVFNEKYKSNYYDNSRYEKKN